MSGHLDDPSGLLAVAASSTTGTPSRPGRPTRWSEWLVTKPWAVVAALGALGLIVRHSWLGTRPVVSGDWHWPSRARILQWFPWPSIWDGSVGFSGQNAFSAAFRFPVFAADGVIAALGGSWTVAEKVIYFGPYSLLLPVAGWLLAREILGPTRWAILAPLLLLGNTYLLTEANGEIPLVFAEVFGCFALVAFLRCMRLLSVRWALVAGLLVGATTAMDVRPAFLTVLLIAGYMVILSLAEPGWLLLRTRILLGGGALAVFLGSQMFWLVPFLTYNGRAALPTRLLPDFSIITLAHGIGGVSAAWTGGAPAALVQAPLNPMFLVLPLVAMVPLLRRKMRPELIWLALAAVICAFLAKTDTPPFGWAYDWIYVHVPGFNLFREGSKFFFPIVIAYAVLIPAGLQAMVETAGGLRERRRHLMQVTTGVALAVVLVVTGSGILVLERGQLGATTTPFAEPQAFKDINTLLVGDHRPGTVLWVGSPVASITYQKAHEFLISSPTHPVVNLTGSVKSPVFSTQDLLQYFCPVISQPYCYVNPTVFPYLANMVGASYVISPGGPEAGSVSRKVGSGFLSQQLTAILGKPRAVGDSQIRWLIWHIPSDVPAVSSYPAVALVHSGPWSIANALPALQAMGVPAAYTQTPDWSHFSSAPSDLPESVGVFPRINSGCVITAPSTVGVMAHATTTRLDVEVHGAASSLGLLATSPRDPGWGLYGPVSLTSGPTPITSPAAGVALGPCVQWSALTATAFGDHAQLLGRTIPLSHGEQLRAPPHATLQPWIELRRLFDLGWRLNGHAPIAPADGLFNLYHTPSSLAASHKLTLTYSTSKWERRGQIVAGLTVLVALILIVAFARRERRRPPLTRPAVVSDSRAASFIGAFGLLFLGLTFAAAIYNWFGVPSRAPWTAIIGDPYSLDVVFGTASLALLGLAMFVRLGEQLGRSLPIRLPSVTARRPRRLAAVAGVSILVVLCAGTALTVTGLAGSGGQAAGAPSSSPTGSSIEQARLQHAAKRARICVADYTKALRTYPNLASAYAGRASCYRSAKANANTLDSAAAVHDIQRALSLSPVNPGLWLQAAQAERVVGDLPSAVADYVKAASLPSATASTTLNAIDGLVSSNRPVAGTVSVAALQRFPNSALIRLGVADLAIANGDETGATAALSDAARLAVASRAERSAVLARQCSFEVAHLQYALALVSCRQGSELNPNNSGLYDDLSVVEVALGDLDQAIVEETSAIGARQGNAGPNSQSAGVNGSGLARLFESRGRLYIQAHRPKLAIADYRHAETLLPPAAGNVAARLRAEIVTARHD